MQKQTTCSSRNCGSNWSGEDCEGVINSGVSSKSWSPAGRCGRHDHDVGFVWLQGDLQPAPTFVAGGGGAGPIGGVGPGNRCDSLTQGRRGAGQVGYTGPGTIDLGI